MAYWQKRQEAAYKAGELKVNQYFSKLEKAFNQAKRELQKTIESFYWRYAKQNGLTYAEAQKRLDKAEIGELREYIDLVMQNIGKYNQKVNNMSIKARVTRYQALEAQIDAILRELYAVDYEADAGKMMSEIYTDTYHRIWYDSDRYRGFHAEFAKTDARTVEELIKYPFNGANFSDRLWKQKDHLQSQLMESLTTMMIQGTAPQNIAKDFAKKMRVKKFDAYRLLHTESSFVMSEATHAGYKEDGVEQYQILATLDSKTCGICGRLDRKIYPVSEAVVGKNMPPFHPFCRCTDVPYYPDTPTEGQMRAARDADGNDIEVPESMTYEEWRKKYLEDKKQSSIKDIENGTESDKMISGARITDIFSDEAEKFAEMYYEEIRSFSTDSRKIAQNLNKDERDIQKIKEYLFEDESLVDSDTGKRRRFDPDCAIAQSWQRLMIGNDIKPHDRTLIEHELLEMRIKKENPGIDHQQAHEMASSKYDYPKEVLEYYGNLEKHKKDK